MARRCIVCKGTITEVGQNRCSCCRTAKAATDAGMSYGQYVAKFGVKITKIEKPKLVIQRKCQYCGQIFEVSNQFKNKKFCSYDCINRASFDAKSIIMGVIPPAKKICPICGTEFTSIRGKYCSGGCKAYANSHSNVAFKQTCPTCRKKFDPTSRNQVYCSKSCRIVSVRERERIYKETMNARNKSEVSG